MLEQCDYRTVFSFNRWEIVKSYGLGQLSLQYIQKVGKVKIYFHFLHAANSLLLGLFGCTMVTVILRVWAAT